MIPALLLLQLWCTVAAGIIVVRAFNVLYHMSRIRRSRSLGAWWGFGLGYILLAVAAAGSAIAVWHEDLVVGYAVWLTASAFMILFDRRSRGVAS